ncbi:helix-turn-helix domain-containing protein [Microbacterium betulae]|uniref:Helix-turn-helix domain-containing protein n=1 Tax=Microbacterium betulae TaxID=2981139 RepID=A0AA97FIS0_9MICO|nr:helix-turn-helix domain-containing protein [Microbacterium sp. AB]WOF23800.1 helix-turn-helix domain-containing protein [Microbacterium sp. AB]
MSNITPLRADGATPAPEVPGFEDMPAVMSPKTLAGFLETTAATLQRWRAENTGPAYITIPDGRMIRYTRADVIAWLTSARVEPRGKAS